MKTTIKTTVLTRTTDFLLRRICQKLVRQGPFHQARITAYYRIMHEAARKEFTEDNVPTLNGFLQECHEAATKRDLP